MDINDGFKKNITKNRTCYYFDKKDINIDNTLIDKK